MSSESSATEPEQGVKLVERGVAVRGVRCYVSRPSSEAHPTTA